MGKQFTPIRRRADLDGSDPSQPKERLTAARSRLRCPGASRTPIRVRCAAERPGTGRARRTSRRAVRARLTRPATRRSRGASGARRARTPSARGWAALVARRGPSIGARGGVQRRRHPRETRVASLQTRANARVRAGASARGAASHDGRLHRRRRRREDAVDRRPGARALPPGRRRRDARRDAIFFLDNDAVDASRDATPSTKRATRPPPDPAPRRR